MSEETASGYFEKPAKTESWSGLETHPVYRPEDVSIDYERDLGDPGEYPYTRGLFPEGYRSRFWTRRLVAGLGTAADTNERLRFLTREGATGLNVIFDIPGMNGIDGDHPLVAKEVGVQGTSMSCLDDMRDLLDGIDQSEVSFSFPIASYAAPGTLAMYLTVAEERGVPFDRLRGTTQADALHVRYAGYPKDEFGPIDLCLRSVVDNVEYCTQHLPRWNPLNVNAYDLRENGLTAPQEIAFAFAEAFAYVDACLERGLGIDDFASRLAFYCSCHVDLFEEVAKLRAMRRLWARLLRERYGAEAERSLMFRFAVHTAGCSLVPQQPLNNIVRVAYEALAATLAGASSLHCCSYDEPIALPSEESHRVALRTQQILAYEVGVGRVADPLGGSWYVESLTDDLEQEALEWLRRIEEDAGGYVEATRTGWLDEEIDRASYRYQKQVETGERVLVGVNAFRIPPEDDTQVDVYRSPPDAHVRVVKRLGELRASRDDDAWRSALERLHARARDPEENLVPHLMEAFRAGATYGETYGYVRLAHGLRYDPLGALDPPFAIDP